MASTTNGPVAVGNEGYVLGRSSGGSWGVVLDDGPGARGRDLHAVDATDDGKRVWFAGASGTFGHYDIPNRRRRDYSRPLGSGNTFHGITVEGSRGSEKFLLADGSGNVAPGEMTDGRISWEAAQKPNSGDAINDLDAADSVGYAIDGNSNVWETTPQGWQRVGINSAEKSFYAIHVDGKGLLVGGGSGRIYESDTGHGWTPYDIGEFTVHALDRTGDESVAAGDDGNIYYRKGKREWVDTGWSGDVTIEGALVGDPSIAVGQNGVIVEQKKKGKVKKKKDKEKDEDGSGKEESSEDGSEKEGSSDDGGN